MDGEKYGNVMGGKLALKGMPLKEKKKSKKKRKREKEETSLEKTKGNEEILVPIAGPTRAQKKHEKFKAKREEEEIAKQASKTYRERVDEYSKYLGSLSEHHDIPRVSAAGNG